MIKILLLSIGLMLIFEGFIYFLFARNMKKYLEQLNNLDPNILKNISSVCFGLGVCLIYFILRFYE